MRTLASLVFEFSKIYGICLQKSNSSVEELAHTILEKKGVPDIIGIFTYFFDTFRLTVFNLCLMKTTFKYQPCVHLHEDVMSIFIVFESCNKRYHHSSREMFFVGRSNPKIDATCFKFLDAFLSLRSNCYVMPFFGFPLSS